MEPSVLSRSFTADGSDFLVYHLGDLHPAGCGRVLELSFTLLDICPDRRVAAAVTLWELDGDDQRQPRGARILTIPPHHEAGPRDIEVGPIRFILPGELDVSGGGGRRFTAEAECHYIDRNDCCLLAAGSPPP